MGELFIVNDCVCIEWVPVRAEFPWGFDWSHVSGRTPREWGEQQRWSMATGQAHGRKVSWRHDKVRDERISSLVLSVSWWVSWSYSCCWWGDFLLVLALAVLFFLCAVSLCFWLSSRVGMIEDAYSLLGMANAFTARLRLWFPLWKGVHKDFCWLLHSWASSAQSLFCCVISFWWNSCRCWDVGECW